jgi:RNA polymerase sigma-70 factor (ECF subfamily)
MTALVQHSKVRALPDDFDKIFKEHHSMVYRAAYRVTGNAADAEDVLQTLFLRLLRRERPPEFQSNPKAYLHRAAVNIALDVIRARKRNVTPDESMPNMPVDDRTREAFEAHQIVLSALAELPQKAAEMFLLKYVEGYNNHEIAKLVGTSRGAVAVMLFRARARLKKSVRRLMEGKL